MTRSFAASLLSAAVVWGWCAPPASAQAPSPAPAAASAAQTEVDRQASVLEAELGKYNDNSPEAADRMVALAELYHRNGRVFGLIRAAQRFVQHHPTDKRHRAVMLQLVDGLEATSRNKEIVNLCRQYLSRYPESPEAAQVEQRLADTLVQLGDPTVIDVLQAIWNRRKATPQGREAALQVVSRLAAQTTPQAIARSALLCEELFDTAGPQENAFAQYAGLRAFHEWRRGSDWAKSNLAGHKLLRRNLPTDPLRKYELHYYMGHNSVALGQNANAVESFRQAVALQPSPSLHMQWIQAQHAAQATPAQMEPVVQAFLKAYADRPDAHRATSYLAQAYLRAMDKTKAAALLAGILEFDAGTNGNASAYVAAAAEKPEQLPAAIRTLEAAIAKNPSENDQCTLRYVLAFEVHRDRAKDAAATARVLRDLLAKSPSNDHRTTNAVSWLLDNPADDAAFKQDLALVLATRKRNLHLRAISTHLPAWLKTAQAKKELKERVAFARDEIAKAAADLAATPWDANLFLATKAGEEARDAYLAGPDFAKAPEGLVRSVVDTHLTHLFNAPGAKKRTLLPAVNAKLAARFPSDRSAAVAWLTNATDYGTPEECKAAGEHVLKFELPWRNTDLWRRIMLAADRAKDADLAKRGFEWIRRSETKYGREAGTAAYVGDVLAKYGMEADAIALWTAYLDVDRLGSDSRECAMRLYAKLKPEEREAFLRKQLPFESDYHGRYASMLANLQYEAGDFAGFAKTLADNRARQNQRPLRGWDFDETYPQTWVDRTRLRTDVPDAARLQVLDAVRDLRFGRQSAAALVAGLSLRPADPQQAMPRLLALQAATRQVGDTYLDWDVLLPFVQKAMGTQDHLAAATLLTGMLSNIPAADAARKQAGRELIGQCYARMGAVGLTIDEGSPIAPLLQAALYLRLGDENLALQTYTANRKVFDEHRNELPVDLLQFVCESHMAAGGDENQNRVEDILRGWLVKHGESPNVEAASKAKLQLLLARNYFKAQRYDLARSEFTTLANRWADTPEAIEAQFGIGETFMAQKVYDQAQLVFEKLATSRLTDVVVRAEFLRGVLASRRGDRDEARDIFRGVLERVPNVELANQALYNLSEVYGAEERYIDQLNLLRTVGRLGRASKRWHKPGTALSIVVQDADLGISRGHNRIPVLVTTEPGGDKELIYLVSGGAGKGLFRADLETKLGQVVGGDRILQLTGKDLIRCDYPEEFKAEFKSVPLSDVDIRVAADAEFELSSGKIVDKTEETFSQQLAREAKDDENADKRVSQGRPTNQVKPGNPVYLRVQDPDRDLSDAPDKVMVKLVSDSGDQVQVALTETGPHTGVFEGTAKTGELPAGALATDTAIEHSPLMAIDPDPATFWQSIPDGATPKSLTIDMKDVKRAARVAVTTPQLDRFAPVRATLFGSDDGLYWFRLGSNPEPAPSETISGEFGAMQRRVYAGNFSALAAWKEVADLTKNGTPTEQVAVEHLSYEPPAVAEGETVPPFAVVWHGRFVQHRPGAVRFAVQGVKTALAIDGRLEIAPGPGGRTVDVHLAAGAHDLVVFAAGTAAAPQPVGATLSVADHKASEVQLRPFRKSDLDLSQPAAANVVSSSPPAAPGLTVAERTWEFRFAPVEIRYVRLDVHEYLGEAVAVAHVEVAGERPDEKFIPTQTDILALAANDVLEIAGGDKVTATYTDDLTQSESGASRLLSSSLQATYFNGSVAPIAYVLSQSGAAGVNAQKKALLRIEPGERVVFEITDFDRDETGQPDSLEFEVFVNDGAPVKLVATETQENSGIFTKEVDTSDKPMRDRLTVKAGDRIYARYVDQQNTFPGHSVPRESVVYVNVPTDGAVRLYETRVILPKPGTQAKPTFAYARPEEGTKVSRLALEVPVTVEVIDPDMAKDSLSSVVVKLATTDGATVDVKCVVSDSFRTTAATPLAGRAGGAGQALEEGRFIGQVILQLGGKGSADLVPLTADMPRGLVGGPVMPEETENSGERLLSTRVLNLTGKDVVAAAYEDARRPQPGAEVRKAQGRLVTTGTLAVTDRDYAEEAKSLHVGERLFVMVTDPDRDVSDERDTVDVQVTTERGEKEILKLVETLAHSGVFTMSAALKPAEKPTAGNLAADDPAVESYFGDVLKLTYEDPATASAAGAVPVLREIPVVIGTDGLVAAFSKTFSDEKLAVETKFHIAESYFELFKSHNALGRSGEIRQDLEAGRRVLREVMEDYPDPRYVPRIAYLLGQFSQELKEWREAIESYETIVTRYPEHSLAPDAQYKLAQCYEESSDFERALEAYVTLAATYPKSPLIASVMIRISDHFYKQENFLVAAQVGEKFLDRFEGHEHASRMAFRVGQCYYKAKDYVRGGGAFDAFAKRFPDDALCPDALFWGGESFRMAKNNKEAFRRYNKCRWDFPASEASKYARGRLALPEMLQQFEQDVNNLDKQ